MDISIIYINYNTIDLIKDSIDSVIKKTSGLTYEIIVVDNNTQDLRLLLSLYHNIRIVQLKENLGFGRANNAGAEIAKGDFLFFLNPDTLLINNAIKEIFDVIKRDKKAGVVGGNLYGMDGSPIHSYNDDFFTWKQVVNKVWNRNVCKKDGIKRQFNFTNSTMIVGYVTGADLMISHNLFKKIGGFNKRMFMYFEDVDLCYKAKREGFYCINVPSAKIKHLEGQSLSFIKDADIRALRRRKMNIDSRKVFLKYTMNPFESFLKISCELVIDYTKFWIERFYGKENPGLKQMADDDVEYLKYILF